MNLAFELQEIANEAKELNRVLFALQDLRIEQTLDLKLFMIEIRENETAGLLEDIFGRCLFADTKYFVG